MALLSVDEADVSEDEEVVADSESELDVEDSSSLSSLSGFLITLLRSEAKQIFHAFHYSAFLGFYFCNFAADGSH